jgi:hypothetical protein
MLSFVVLEPPGTTSAFALRHACCLGPDDNPIQATIALEADAIRIDRPTTDSTALCLQFPVGPATPGAQPLGLLTLRTCLLPDRAEPYLLSIELARHRIMLVLNKLEQWAMFDLASDSPGMVEFEQARAEFTNALVAMCHRGPTGPDETSMRQADAAARRALALAIDASERLTLLQAERQLRSRIDGSAFKEATERIEKIDTVGADRVMPEGAAKPPDGVGIVLPRPASVGVAINPAAFADVLTKVAASTSDFISMPMRWIDMEPTEGKYAFAKTDKWIEWAVRTAKVPVHAGPLIDFRELCVPEWLYIWEHDYETLRELVYEHVKSLVTRYRKTVTRWTVCSGLHVNESFAMTLERMMDLTRICALLVRKLQPGAKVQVEVARPWGEYIASNKRSMPPRLYAEMIQTAGIAIDALAIRIQMGHPLNAAAGRSTRDLMAISDLLDRYAELDKPIAITALGAPSAPITPAPPILRGSKPAAPAEDPGYWRQPWSPAAQQAWLREVVRICASKPFVTSVCWQDLYDLPPAQAAGNSLGAGGSEMPFGGLLTDQGAPKPAAATLAELRRAIHPMHAAKGA